LRGGRGERRVVRHNTLQDQYPSRAAGQTHLLIGEGASQANFGDGAPAPDSHGSLHHRGESRDTTSKMALFSQHSRRMITLFRDSVRRRCLCIGSPSVSAEIPQAATWSAETAASVGVEQCGEDRAYFKTLQSLFSTLHSILQRFITYNLASGFRLPEPSTTVMNNSIFYIPPRPTAVSARAVSAKAKISSNHPLAGRKKPFPPSTIQSHHRSQQAEYARLLSGVDLVEVVDLTDSNGVDSPEAKQQPADGNMAGVRGTF
jgi:hypothetical protein